MSEAINFTVYGTPQPAGSKKHVGNGRVVDASKKSRPWKNNVAQVAGEHAPEELLSGSLELQLVFYRARPKGHYGTGRNSEKLKPSAPEHPTTKPDVLKLARGVEDALTGVIWFDDAQIVDEKIYKRYGTPERVEVTVGMIGES